MVRTVVVLATLVLLPSVAQSQRSRDRGTKADFDQMSRSGAVWSKNFGERHRKYVAAQILC